MEDEDGIPNLTQHVQVTNYAPEFSGIYSSVHKGTLHEKLVAVKVIRPLSVSVHTMKRKVERERAVWARLRHQNIVPLYGYTDANMFFGPFGALISPWYQYGDADKFFNENGHLLTMDQRKVLWCDVVAGVNYLHSQNPPIVHGDLKPGNILIDDHGVAKICDFGLVHILMEKGDHSGMTTTSAHMGTARYLPYELVTSQSAEQLSEASDVYSMGCVGLFFLFLQSPYNHRKHNNMGDIFRDITNGVPPATRPAEISTREAQIWLILESCWGTEPIIRPSSMQVLKALHISLAPPSTIHLSSDEPPLLPQVLPLNGMEDDLRTDTNPQASIEQQQLTATAAAAHISPNRRKGHASFICPVPGCDKTFTRHFNLKAHLRSHSEARPFTCKWPGCEKGFTRQNDCKRHEVLHLNLRPYTCDGCGKTFARMEAFAQHQEGANCARALDNPLSGSIFRDVN